MADESKHPRHARRLEGAIRTSTSPRPGAERRVAHRARSFLTGKIIINDGAITADAVIRDLSVDGARVRVSKALGLPRTVALLAVRDGLLFEADIMWRRGDEIGLAFTNRRDLHGDTDASRYGVRALWDSLSPR